MDESSKTKTPNISVISESTQNLVGVYTRRRFLSKHISSEKRLLIIIVIFVVLFLVFFIAFIIVQQQYHELLDERFCTSSECIESSIMMLQTVDLTQDPCDDFFKYACGNFEKEHPITDAYMHNSWFLEKENRLNSLVHRVIEKPILHSDLKSVKQTKHFYRACVNGTELDLLGLKPLYAIMDLLMLSRTIPNSDNSQDFNLGKTLALAQRHLSEDILVTVSLARGPTNLNPELAKNGTLLKISPGVAGLNIFDNWKPDSDIFSAKQIDPFRRPPDDDDGNSDINKGPSYLSSQQVILATVKFVAEVLREIVDDLENNYGIVNDYNSTQLVSIAYKTIMFTAELVKDWNSVNRTSGPNEEQTTFAALQVILDEASENAQLSNRIDWKEYVTTLFEKVNKTYDIENDVVIVHNLEYFKHLSKVLGKSKPEAIQRHIWWHIVENFARYTTTDMRVAYTKYYQTMYGEASTSTRAQSCTAMAKKLLNIALSHEMASVNNFSSAIHKVREMLKDIQNVFVSMVESLTWMDEETKTMTLDKAQSVTNDVGYAEWISDPQKINEFYENLHLKESEYLLNIVRIREWEVKRVLDVIGPDTESMDLNVSWYTNPLQVNAYYSRHENAIAIPAGILQTPFYFRGLESLNYGAIGTILGHELTHGFDIEGKNYNKMGERQENLWPDSVTNEYLNRAQCFIDQYGKYKVYKNKRLNGTYTLAENIADNGGMRESYKAYQLYKARHGKEPLLPGFENFTNEQLLFLSFANIWCETSTSKFRRLLEQDSHSPHRVRVLATLQNMKEFSEAFQCPSNSFMNPTEKCIIW